MKQTLVLGISAGFLLLSASCEMQHVATGPLETIPFKIDAGTYNRGHLELDMGAGELRLTGGAEKLIDGSFEYNVPSFKPEVIQERNGSSISVTVKQPHSGGSFGNSKNLWDLQLTNNVPFDIDMNCGAGKARLELGDVTLHDLQIHMGAGQVDLDLTGKPRQSYEVGIKGGVGQVTVHLPEGVGIWASAHGGLGSIKVSGLENKGGHWQNSLYGQSPIEVKVEVDGGIGEIRLIE